MEGLRAISTSLVLPTSGIAFVFVHYLKLRRIEATLCSVCCARREANDPAKVEHGDKDTEELKRRLQDCVEAVGAAPPLEAAAVDEALRNCAALVRC